MTLVINTETWFKNMIYSGPSRQLRVELSYLRFRTCPPSYSNPPCTPDLGVFGWVCEAPGGPGGHLGASRPMLLRRKVKKLSNRKKPILKRQKRQKPAQHGFRDGHRLV